MTKNYQTSRPMTSAELRLALPETVSVAMGEIAEDVQRTGARRRAVNAALDVLTGKVIGQCLARHRHEEFLTFLRTPSTGRFPRAWGCS